MKQLSKLKITASILGLVLVIIMYTTITNFNKLMAAGGITILIIFVGEIIRLFVDPKEIVRIIGDKKLKLTGNFKW